LIGGLITDASNRPKVVRANPITYVSRDDPPFLIVHGDQDPLVPHHQSEMLFAALKAAGVPVRLNTVKGGGNGAGFGGAELEKMRRDSWSGSCREGKNDCRGLAAAMTSSTDAVAIPAGAKKELEQSKENGSRRWHLFGGRRSVGRRRNEMSGCDGAQRSRKRLRHFFSYSSLNKTVARSRGAVLLPPMWAVRQSFGRSIDCASTDRAWRRESRRTRAR
jgi:hypothetical protein